MSFKKEMNEFLKTKFTKGNWEVWKSPRGIVEVLGGEEKKEIVALVGKNENNANLISAAPLLFEALQTWEAANALGDNELLLEARRLRSIALDKSVGEFKSSP